VVADEVDQHPQSHPVCVVHQRVEVGQHAHGRVHVGMVGDVIAEVDARGAVEG